MRSYCSDKLLLSAQVFFFPVCLRLAMVRLSKATVLSPNSDEAYTDKTVAVLVGELGDVAVAMGVVKLGWKQFVWTLSTALCLCVVTV